MINFSKGNDNDILKKWIEYSKEITLCTLTPQDKKYNINFDEISKKIYLSKTKNMFRNN